MEFPFGDAHVAGGLDLYLHRHPLLPGQQAQGVADPLDDGRGLHRLGLLLQTAVQPGEAQQVLGDAAQALRLLPDVHNELPDHVVVHVLRLQNGVGEEADGGQGGFQLVGGVGDEAAAGVLGDLEAAGEVVELVGDLGDLVVAPHVRPVVVGPLPDPPHGGEQVLDPPGEELAEEDAQRQHHRPDADGDAHQILLQILQQLRLRAVVLIDVHRADGLAAVDHRGGGGGAKGPVLVHRVEGVIALQRLHQLGVEHVIPGGAAHLACVVEHPAGGGGDDGPGHAGDLHQGQGRVHILLRQLTETGEGRGHGVHAALEGALLGEEEHLLGHVQRVGVHKDQHHADNQDVADTDFKL